MKKIVLSLATAFLISCGSGGGESNGTLTPEVVSEGAQYTLKVDTKAAEIVLPTASPVTLQEVSQKSIFSLYREPYAGTFDEGNIDNALVVNLKVLNIPNRTLVPFEITGIAVADIQSMILNGVSYQPALTGYFDLGAQGAVGFADLVIIFKADQVTEGIETMNLKLLSSIATVNSLSINAVINDTSTTPATPQPTYTLSKVPGSGAVNEGDSATITLNTTGVAPGTLVAWNIIGISPDDIAIMVLNGISQTPTVSGNFILDSVGSASMTVLFKNDLTTEGAETMTLGVVAAGQPTVSISINDTSTTPTPIVDNTNPTIALTSITNFVANTYLTVSGVAVDNVGIASVVWINRINGVIVGQGNATLTQNGNYATWTIVNLPLQIGNNNIEFTATDTSGRTASEIIVVAGNLATTGQSTAEEPTMVAEKSIDIPEKWPTWPQMQLVDAKLGWEVSQKNIVGTTSRVELFRGQDPFPFCAAYAASILHDQHECMTNKTSCISQPRTSALSLVSSSQPFGGKLSWNSGGSAFLALNKIVHQKGAAHHSKCNYDFITNHRINRINDFAQVHAMYNSYRHAANGSDANHMKYWSTELEWKIMALGFPKPNVSQLTSKMYTSIDDMITDLIIKPECDVVSLSSSKQYKINTIKNPSMDIEVGYKEINRLLKSNTPVMVDLCLNAHVGFAACSKHTHIITAQGKATNKTTGDVRTVYKVVSTWGEAWHKAHNDGWVFADVLLAGVYEIIWLE